VMTVVTVSPTAASLGAATPKSLAKDVVVNGTVDQVWEAWTTSKGVTTFFAPSARVEPRVGGPFEIYFNTKAEPGQQGSEGCKVMAVDPKKMLSFSWNAPPTFPTIRGQCTLVTVFLEPAGEGKTKVELQHIGWGRGEEWEKVYAYFDGAWTYVLGNLKTRFETGPIKWPEGPAPLRVKHFVYFIRPSRPDLPEKPTDAEAKTIGEHFQYLKQALASGKLILAGPSTERPYTGIVVFQAKDIEDAKAFMNGDPAVKAGVFIAEVYPFSLALH
jgi:uncharacterized protein YndB with AHSA1/START domain/uncharacterized protein YciI